MVTTATIVLIALTPVIMPNPQENRLTRLVRRTADSYDVLLDALSVVESNNNPKAGGDFGKAIGILQIWPVFVDDVNRILGKNVYTYKDRWCPVKSREMAKIYLSHYATGRRLGRTPTFEDMAAMYCAGPNGWQQKDEPKVKRYIEKVKKVLK